VHLLLQQLAGGLIAGGVMAHYATKDRYKSMAREQEQQEQLQQAQAQAGGSRACSTSSPVARGAGTDKRT
jgi:uncharacterized membrane protein YebE (DUF533 family)